MKQIDLIIENKNISLYPSEKRNSPLIVLNSYENDGEKVVKQCRLLDNKDFNLLVIYGLDWDKDRTPYPCPALNKYTGPFQGKAKDYLQTLIYKILPEAEKILFGNPTSISLVGYSLAGLFALYATYQCDVFSSVGSISGSLWYPSFDTYCFSTARKKKPNCIYLSLGDKEKISRQPLLSKVEEKTISLYEHYKTEGIQTLFELNPGNHFQNPELRIAKGISYLLKHQ